MELLVQSLVFLNLKVLRIEGHLENIDLETIDCLTTSLPRSQIEELYLKNTKFGDEGLEKLCSGDDLFKSNIDTLSIENSSLTDGGVEYFFSVLSKLHLISLNISHNPVGNEDVFFLY